MNRKPLVLAIAASVVVCAAFVTSGSNAAATDIVQLRVESASIDAALRFSTPSGWSWRCTSTIACAVNVARGTLVTVVAENGAASRFQAWEGACGASGAQPTCIIQVNENALVTARFSPLRLWLPAFGGGSITWEPVRPGGAPLVARPCGPGCFDFANGEQLRLRAVPASNSRFRMTDWGGTCANVPRNHNCLITMRSNYVVSATFEEPPPSRNCEPGRSCDGVGIVKPFIVRVIGPGTVVVPRYRDLGELTCATARPEGRTCGFSRPPDMSVELQAAGGRFLRWESQPSVCRGNQPTCSFANKSKLHRNGPPTIVARFG
jgi:hypothetical protein